MEKSKVVAVLIMVDDEPVLHYLKDEQEIRDTFLKQLLRDATVSFDNLEDYMVKHIKETAPMFIGLTSINERLAMFSAVKNKQIDSYTKYMQVGSCCEGAINFECFEMTDEEFANPTGELMSPYAGEDGEEPTRNKYSYRNPITGEIVFKK